ncbi:MAG: hypothetical protein H6825_05230 [Planctomycetes bacterium]|nr:hypothetical protein [Planctomycetota bacterium]
MFRLPLRRLGSSLIAATLTCGLATAQDADKLFDQGIDAFRRGDNTAALEAFKQVLATNPSNDEAYRLIARVEDQVMLEMLVERGELGKVAERFLGLAKVGRQVVASDPGGAEAVVDKLLDGTATERQSALLELQGTYGAWAVKALLRPLADRSDTDRRVAAQQALLHLGDVAVVPLMAALGSDDELLRTNVVATLGSLRDVRAAASLAWLARYDESDVVKQMAATGLEKMRDGLESIGLGTTDALTLTIGLAQRWLTGDADIVRPYDAAAVRWTWDGGLQGTPVLNGMYTLDLAQMTLAGALEHAQGADRERVRSWLAAVEAAKLAEIDAANDVPDLQGDLLDAARDQVARLHLDVALAGPLRGDALSILVENQLFPAAAALAGVMGGSERELDGLRSAMGIDSAGLGVTAAQALARLGDGSSGVVERLGASLAGVPERLVVTIGDVGLSSGGGWSIESTDQALAGLARAKSFPPKDVVVVRDGVGGVTLDTLVFGLKDDPRSKDIPLVIVTDDTEGVGALYGDRATVVGAMTAADLDQLVTDGVVSDDAARTRLLARVLVSAQVLATLSSSSLSGLGSHVAASLDSGLNDEVKTAVLMLAGRAGAVEALPKVEDILLTDGDHDLMVAAMHAAARLWAAAGISSGRADVREALSAQLEGGDEELAQAAAEALGQFGADAPVMLAAH